VEEPDKVMMDTLYRVEEGDLVVNITFAWEGAIAFVPEKDSGGLVSHRFPTYRLKETEVDRGFFRNLIQTKRFVWDLGLISPGGAGRNRVLSQKDFLKQKVHVPSLGVQERVGEMLEAAYDELRLCEEYLVALEKQKRGLMQKLLTGEVRVRA
jgi:type I restriction enzyme S subunit